MAKSGPNPHRSPARALFKDVENDPEVVIRAMRRG